MKEKIQRAVSIQNRRARFDYELLDTYTAGMVLVGTEIKSLRANISEYFYGSYNNHAARRDRKLLLNRKELRKLEAYVQSPGVTIVPVKIFINDRGLAKVVIAPARGKKVYDKRATMRERDDRREMDRAMKR